MDDATKEFYRHMYYFLKHGPRPASHDCPEISRSILANRAIELQPEVWGSEFHATCMLRKLNEGDFEEWQVLRRVSPEGYAILKPLSPLQD